MGVALEWKGRASVSFAPDSEQRCLLNVRLFTSVQPCSAELFPDPIRVPSIASHKSLTKCFSGARPLARRSSPPSGDMIFDLLTLGEAVPLNLGVPVLRGSPSILSQNQVMSLTPHALFPEASQVLSGAPAAPQGFRQAVQSHLRFPTPWARKPGH